MSSSDFYDNFISYQIKSGINDRIYGLYKRLCKMGLSTDSNILEIGSGIGTLTFLLSRKIKKGHIISVDISPKSVEYSKTFLNLPNINFHVSDILNFEPERRDFDKILLFDVIEHIPVENHIGLFKRISTWMNDQTLLFINFPNPNYILFNQIHNPETLQETDQPVFIDRLAGIMGEAALDIEYLQTYSVWVRNDYHFLIVKKRTEFTKLLVSSDQSLISKIKSRIARDFRKIVFRYPVKKNK